MIQNTVSGVFIWARCGGGHRTAKDALIDQIRKKESENGKEFTTVQVDVTTLIPLGDEGVHAWDSAQKRGDLAFLKAFASKEKVLLADAACYIPIRSNIRKILRNLPQEPKYVISTQAFGIAAIADAILSVNKEDNLNMHLDVYLTDLPTIQAVHFFAPLHHVGTDISRSSITTLHTAAPFTKPNISASAYFKELCGEHLNISIKDTYPVRQPFLDTEELKKQLQEKSVALKINHPDETEILRKGCSKVTIENNTASLLIDDDDIVSFLMLGSQPTEKSVLNWLNSMIVLSQEGKKKKGKTHYFFLYCGAPHTNNTQNTLLQKVKEQLDQNPLSAALKVIPFTNQDASCIAHLMARSDCTITRSGGATCMELLQIIKNEALPQRKNRLTFIHSEAEIPTDEKIKAASLKLLLNDKYKELQEDLFKQEAIEYVLRKEGTVVWEDGNARYLKKSNIGTHVVNPDSAKPFLKKILN